MIFIAAPLPLFFFLAHFANTDTDICMMQSCKSHRNDIITQKFGNFTLSERDWNTKAIVASQPTRFNQVNICNVPKYLINWDWKMKRMNAKGEWKKKEEESLWSEERNGRPIYLVADGWNVLFGMQGTSPYRVLRQGYLWAFLKAFASKDFWERTLPFIWWNHQQKSFLLHLW